MAPANRNLNSSSGAGRLNESKLEEVVPTNHCNNITEACLECISLLCKEAKQYAVNKGRLGRWKQ